MAFLGSSSCQTIFPYKFLAFLALMEIWVKKNTKDPDEWCMDIGNGVKNAFIIDILVKNEFRNESHFMVIFPK